MRAEKRSQKSNGSNARLAELTTPQVAEATGGILARRSGLPLIVSQKHRNSFSTYPAAESTLVTVRFYCTNLKPYWYLKTNRTVKPYWYLKNLLTVRVLLQQKPEGECCAQCK